MYLERRALPRCSKITYKRQIELDQKLHRSRLKTIKPSIDNKPPKKHAHLRRNLKREQMMEERFATIERENRILLSKMSDIMQHNTLDNVNRSVQYSHSLNKTHRKKELQRITAENQAILRRIQQREPVYNHFQWEEERAVNEKYLSNIQEHPSMAFSKTGRTGPLGTRSRIELDDEGGYLEPMDEEYKRDSRERMDYAAGGEEDYTPGGRAPHGHLDPLGRDARGAPSGGGASAGAGAAGPEDRSRGGVESRGDIARDADAGDVAEATLFSVGRKFGDVYYMVSQSHAGEISLYNPFTSEAHPLTLPDGHKLPADLEEFRVMVNHLDRTEDGSFVVADKPTI